MITVNGPGELYYWVMPLLNALSAEKVPVQIWIFLTPCQFSSGSEQKALQKNQLVTKIFSPQETMRICWGWSGLIFPFRGLVLFLGGDIFNAVLLKKRSGYPLWIYGSHLRWPRRVDLFLARYRRDYDRYQFSPKVFVGDLLHSYVQEGKVSSTNERISFCSGSPRILFLPGSRSVAYGYILDYYRRVAGLLRHPFPDSTFAFGFPGYYSTEDIPLPDLDHLGIPYFFGETSDLMSQADITVTIPGSNNMELFYRKKQALILLPLESTDQFIPLTGISGLIEKIPGIGPMIKRKVIQSLNRKKKWVSLPNILMNREIYPELRGKIPPENVVSKVKELFHGPPFGIEASEKEFPSSTAAVMTRLVQEQILC